MKNPSIYLQRGYLDDQLPSNGGESKLRFDITSEGIDRIIKGIEKVQNYYKGNNYLEKIIVSIFYKSTTPKSSRISSLFCEKGKDSFATMLGSIYQKIDDEKVLYRHVVTHYITSSQLEEAKYYLSKSKDILDNYLNGIINKEDFSKVKQGKYGIIFDRKIIGKTKFISVLKDASEIDTIDVLMPDVVGKKIISFYPCFKNQSSLKKFLLDINIDINDDNIINATSIIANDDILSVLLKEVPYLIACGTDMSTASEEGSFASNDSVVDQLPNEGVDLLPTIGVFDTFAEEDTFYKKYLKVENLLDESVVPSERDYYHGTKVDSILIMGNKLNPYLEDGCGYFRVKHFIIGTDGWVDFEKLYKQLEVQVKKYCDEIKVWNLSLGDKYGVSPNYISVLGERIDELSRKYNVLFVVAGTNLDKEVKDPIIGGPADSLNALVVNSIDDDKNIPPYARKGPVLTFVQKPDVSYYGGTEEKPLIGYSSNYRKYKCYGTSISVPYIARKCAYLIHKTNVPVQCAKAMIIDAAFRWGDNPKNRGYLGYGDVPIHIDDIINSNRDEIKIVMHGHTMNQRTFIADFPILLEADDTFNYRTKVTFCYFTYGSRNQGVDYADQDIDISIGRSYIGKFRVGRTNNYEDHFKVDNIKKASKIKSGAYFDQYGKEIKRIADQGKWNNTKIIMEKSRTKGMVHQKNEEWGIFINHLDRHQSISKLNWGVDEDGIALENSSSVNFGLVLTFKTIDGTDARYEEFCSWIRRNTNYFLSKIENPQNEVLARQGEKKLKIDK